VDGAVAERLRERLVDQAMLVEERQAVEARAGDDHLEVIAPAGAVLHAKLVRIGERAAQQGLETFDGHAVMLLTGRTLRPMAEIGLFPLGIVLLPTERVPLHIFEPRYQELIGECLDTDEEFGLVYADEEGVREVGTLAHVTEVLERFDDGRLTILVEGGVRFRVEALTRGRSFMTAEIDEVEDDAVDIDPETAVRAAGAFRALAALAGAETDDPDEASPQLSFELAAQVELPPEAKQQLLELRVEQERLDLVAGLLDDARTALIATRELGDRAKRNGSRTEQ
jgi:ATP-dependent Lon protease